MNYKEKLNKISTFIFDVDGVLTDGSLVLMPSGELTRVMNTKDGFAMKRAIDLGYKVAIITGGKDKTVKTRLEGLGVFDIYLGAHNKIEQFNDLLDSYSLNKEECLYMGDDIPDIAVMEKVGLSCCPYDACSDVRSISEYISPFNGGKGCVRDVIEQTLKAHGKWDFTESKIQSV